MNHLSVANVLFLELVAIDVILQAILILTFHNRYMPGGTPGSIGSRLMKFGFLHITAYSVSVLYLPACMGSLNLDLDPVHQASTLNLYPSHRRLIFQSCGFEECNKRSKVAIKSWISSLKLIPLGRDSSTDFCCDYKEDVIIKRIKLVVVYKLKGARVNSDIG